VTLAHDALARLAAADVFSVGDIYWILEEHLNYDSGKQGRYCLLVHIERTGAGAPARAHFVVGSTKRGSQPELQVSVGTAALTSTTYFSFWASSPVDIGTVRDSARWQGRLPVEIQSEIEQAIMMSNLGVLKRLLKASVP
jgi:hypothetical protein